MSVMAAGLSSYIGNQYVHESLYKSYVCLVLGFSLKFVETV